MRFGPGRTRQRVGRLRRALLACAAFTVLPAVLPEAAAAQGRACEILPVPEPRQVRRLAGPTGASMYFISGPFRIACAGGVLVSADSAMSTGTGELRLVGDVYYQDSTRTMTSDYANYFGEVGRLHARGSVVVRERASSNTVSGAELEYEKEMAGRPEARVVVRGRPRAFMYDADVPPLPEGLEPSPRVRVIDGDTIPAALQIDADRLELVGESRMLAHGRAQMVREDLRAFGDAIDYQRTAGELHLVGTARVEGEGYQLFGDRIDATLLDETLEHVDAHGRAALLGEEIEVYGATIRVFLSEGEVERLVAVAPRDLPDGVPTDQRARAFAREFTMVADSIDAIAPGQRIETIIAIGDGYGERAVDSLAVDVPDLVAKDWLRGDTIIGTFTHVESEDSDSAQAQLEQLVAMAGAQPAQSLYRMAAEQDGQRPAVNYLIASRITLDFDAEGEVGEVQADGPVHGVHLEPATETAAETAAGGGADE